MTAREKQAVINADCIAYFSGYSGIEIKAIEYGIEDYVVFVAGAWCSKKSVHKSKVYYTGKRDYFKFNGCRIPLDECIRN